MEFISLTIKATTSKGLDQKIAELYHERFGHDQITTQLQFAPAIQDTPEIEDDEPAPTPIHLNRSANPFGSAPPPSMPNPSDFIVAQEKQEDLAMRREAKAREQYDQRVQSSLDKAFPTSTGKIANGMTGEEVDINGVPYNPAVHSDTRGKNKDLSWRSRRGVDKELVQAYEKQFKRTAGAPPVSRPAPVPASHVPTQIPYAAPTPVAAPYVPPINVAPPVAVAPASIPQYDQFAATRKQAHDFESFKETLIPSLSKLVEDGKVTAEYIGQLKTHFGVNEIWEVNDQQLLEMFEQFVAYGLVNKVGG